MAVERQDNISRRGFLVGGLRGAGILAIGGTVGALAGTAGARAGSTLWQIDPYKCTQCTKCATDCVLGISAVKCMHAFAVCGYCELCTGFFEPQPDALNTGAENQLCPTGALQRKFVEDPYYEYTIDTSLCIGCAKCVKGCSTFGNGSLYMQIDQDRCVHCNRCSIAAVCPGQAIGRVTADLAYIPKTRTRTS